MGSDHDNASQWEEIRKVLHRLTTSSPAEIRSAAFQEFAEKANATIRDLNAAVPPVTRPADSSTLYVPTPEPSHVQ